MKRNKSSELIPQTPVRLSIEEIKQAAADLKDDFQREKDRGLRKSNLAEAQNALGMSEGVDRLIQSLEMMATAPYMRQRREAEDRQEFIRNRMARLKQQSSAK